MPTARKRTFPCSTILTLVRRLPLAALILPDAAPYAVELRIRAVLPFVTCRALRRAVFLQFVRHTASMTRDAPFGPPDCQDTSRRTFASGLSFLVLVPAGCTRLANSLWIIIAIMLPPRRPRNLLPQTLSEFVVEPRPQAMQSVDSSCMDTLLLSEFPMYLPAGGAIGRHCSWDHTSRANSALDAAVCPLWDLCLPGAHAVHFS